MEEYYFLFVLGALWTIFAVVQDMKTREVANWLNFSLIAGALAYRAIYAVIFNNFRFFALGVLGFAVFFILAQAFYYGRVFAGGDAKLLMGFGVLLPYGSYKDLLLVGGGFVILLFLIGALWSLAYSVLIVKRNWGKFKGEFEKKINKMKWIFVLYSLLLLFLIMLLGGVGGIFWVMFGILYLVFIYVKSLEKCMIKKVNARDLREGDWLENDVKIGRYAIRKSVHGLSLREIEKLRKAKKIVLIKDGIPFTPAFLISLGIMVCAYLTLGFSFLEVF